MIAEKLIWLEYLNFFILLKKKVKLWIFIENCPYILMSLDDTNVIENKESTFKTSFKINNSKMCKIYSSRRGSTHIYHKLC